MVALTYLFAALLALAPALLFPADWTGTEGRRLQIALEMAARGDWLLPTLGGEPTLAKPPLHYWVLAAVSRLSTAPWSARLPAVLAFWLLAWCAHRLLQRTHGRGVAYCGGFGVLLAPLVVALVPRAEIDPLFAALAAGSILYLAHGAAFAVRGSLLLGGVLGGCALLSKGPPFFMLLLGLLAVWLRRRAGRGLLWAVVPMVALPAVYSLVLYARHGSLLGEGAFHDIASESVGRLGWFGLDSLVDLPLYVLRVLAASLPYGLFLFYEYRGERRAEPDPPELFVRMLAAAAFALVLVLAVFPARPPRYLLPAVPLFFLAVSPSVAAFVATPRVPPPILTLLRSFAAAAALGILASPWLPEPIGVVTTLGLIAYAALPLWVRDGRCVVSALLLLPAIAAWTWVGTFAAHRARWREPYAQAGAALGELLRRHDARDLATLLHVPSPLLLHAGVLPPGDEFAQQPPRARWLLMEEHAEPQAAFRDKSKVELPPRGYQLRARLQLPRKALLLLERA